MRIKEDDIVNGIVAISSILANTFYIVDVLGGGYRYRIAPTSKA